MKKSPFVVSLCCVLSTSLSEAQPANIQQLSDAYSACLQKAVAKQKQKDKPSIDEVKQACASEIAAFHEALGGAAASVPLDEKLLQALQQ